MSYLSTRLTRISILTGLLFGSAAMAAPVATPDNPAETSQEFMKLRSEHVFLTNNHAKGDMDIWFNDRHRLDGDYESDYNKKLEMGLVYAYSPITHFDLLAGVQTTFEDDNEPTYHGLTGLRYNFPYDVELELLFISDGTEELSLSADHDIADWLALDWSITHTFEQKTEADIDAEFELTDQWLLELTATTTDQYGATLAYEFYEDVAVAVNYDKDRQLGIGLRFETNY